MSSTHCLSRLEGLPEYRIGTLRSHQGGPVAKFSAVGIKVCKFGGSSLANATQLTKVRSIVRDDTERRYVVVSAPGKQTDQDRKITDLLYLSHETATQQLPFNDTFEIIAERYRQIVAELGLKLPIDTHLEHVHADIAANYSTADLAVSRGEYLCGLVMAEVLDYEFIDTAGIIRFDEHGQLDEQQTYDRIGRRLKDASNVVLPGFYGSMPDGQIHTFSRGGSDVTGAILARAIGATVYENWTDVSGLLMADPHIVNDPKIIETITYRELRELAYSGATVLHDEAIFPVREAGIPVHIRNTNCPEAPGTLIVRADEQTEVLSGAITGIAGRKDFTAITVEKALMNREIGYGRRLLSVLEVNGIRFEHLPSGIDTMSVVIADSQLDGRLEAVLDQIYQQCKPDSIEVDRHMALIATVGCGMSHTPGTAAQLFKALANANVNIRMIDQGSSELNIIVGVNVDDYDTAVRAIYEAFVA